MSAKNRETCATALIWLPVYHLLIWGLGGRREGCEPPFHDRPTCLALYTGQHQHTVVHFANRGEEGERHDKGKGEDKGREQEEGGSIR